MRIKDGRKMIRNIVIIIIAIIAIIGILKIAPNYKEDEFAGVTNLIINNNNITDIFLNFNRI